MPTFLLPAVATIALLGGRQTPMPDASPALTAIAAEIRLLRTSIEKANDNEVQIQAIGVFLTNEQGRLVQVGNRLDSIRHDLDAASTVSREAAATVISMESHLAANTVPIADRDQYALQLSGMKRAAEQAAQKEAALRSREQDAVQEFQTERDQYTAMVARLQQFIK